MSAGDLAAFLKARLDEDEVATTPGCQALDDLRFELKRGSAYEQHLSSRIEDGLDGQAVAWEALMRREVKAKRAILADYELWRAHADSEPRGVTTVSGAATGALLPAIRYLAAVYSDHPDYRREWHPHEVVEMGWEHECG